MGPANHVAVIDAKKLEVEKYLLVGQRVWQLAFTPDEKLLFTTNGNSNDVSVIDVPTLDGDQVDAGRQRARGASPSPRSKAGYFSRRAPALGTIFQPRPAKESVASWLALPVIQIWPCAPVLETSCARPGLQ